MNLLSSYSNLSNRDLIRIIETPDAYTQEAQEAAIAVVESRKILDPAKKEIAKELWKTYCTNNFRQIVSDSIRLKSYFLSDEEIKLIMTDAYNYHKDRQKLFEIDLTKYWGAAF